MPLLLKIDDDKEVELAVWTVQERASYFQQKIEMHSAEKEIINQMSTKKRREWLSSRYLLHLMSGRDVRGEFKKDVHGKPHLADSTHHLSISHSSNYVAVIASKLLVGVDIQHYVSKIHRIQDKFVNEGELKDIPEEQVLQGLHIIWGAKESLYKAYGKRKLDFKENIKIHNLTLKKSTGFFHGSIYKSSYHKDFIIRYQLFEKFALVYAKEHI